MERGQKVGRRKNPKVKERRREEKSGEDNKAGIRSNGAESKAPQSETGAFEKASGCGRRSPTKSETRSKRSRRREKEEERGGSREQEGRGSPSTPVLGFGRRMSSPGFRLEGPSSRPGGSVEGCGILWGFHQSVREDSEGDERRRRLVHCTTADRDHVRAASTSLQQRSFGGVPLSSAPRIVARWKREISSFTRVMVGW